MRSYAGLGAELRQDAPQRLVAVVVVLELLQRRQQRVPAALGDADGEHDEERVQPGLLDDHAVLGQELGDDAAGMPVLANLPDTSSPGVMIVHLIGSSMLKPSASAPKPCHFSLADAPSTQSALLPMPSVAPACPAPRP
jgi:hypothetical protein